MKSLAAALIALAVLVVPSAERAQTQEARPKLVVLVTVDQMRGDYVDRLAYQWTRGLHRLLTEGASFRQVYYPYYNTVTCAGHASIGTGTIPAVHGMVLNQWWERNNSRQIGCTDDDDAKLISYGAPLTGVANSAKHLMATTLADEMRLQSAPAPRVVGVSLKARSAINLVGHRPDAVIWLDEVGGEWATSTAFAKAPAPFFAEYIAKHPLKGEMGRTWDRALPLDKYLDDYTTKDRRKTALVTQAFPHIVKGAGAETGAFTDAWESSPFSDEYLNGLAMAAVDGLRLGRGAGTDLLAISFSALDKVGHDFGPDAHETQDTLIRVDAQIGLLLDKLDRDVGKGNYVVGLTADHGVAPVPERLQAKGFDAGRISTTDLGKAVDIVLARELGQGPYSTKVIYNDIFFNEGVYQKLKQNAKAMDAVLDAVRNIPGVARVVRKEEMSAADPFTRASALSHYEGRSGDIKFLSRPYWITSTSTTTHGTAHRYDTRVPLVLFGFGVKKGEHLNEVQPLDLAPTLAFLTGVTLPDATGRVLAEALTRQ